MTEQGWNAVITIVQETYASSEQAFAEQLATAVQAFGVPAPVLERVCHAATLAVDRAFQHDDTRSICLRVSMRDAAAGCAGADELGILHRRARC